MSEHPFLSSAAHAAYSTALMLVLTGYTGKKRHPVPVRLLMANALVDVPIGPKSKAFMGRVEASLGFLPDLPISADVAARITDLALANPDVYKDKDGNKEFLALLPDSEGVDVFASDPVFFMRRVAQALGGYGTHFGAYDTGFGSAPIAMSRRGQRGLKFSGSTNLNRFLVCATTALGDEPSLIEAMLLANKPGSIAEFLAELQVFFPQADETCLIPLKERLGALQQEMNKRSISNSDRKGKPWKVPSIFLPVPGRPGESVETFLFTSHAAREANAQAHQILKEESEAGAKSFKPQKDDLDVNVALRLQESGVDVHGMTAKEKSQFRKDCAAKMEDDSRRDNYKRSRSALAKHLRRNSDPDDMQAHRTHALRRVGFAERSGNPQNLYSGAQGGMRMIRTSPWIQRESPISAFLDKGQIMAIWSPAIEQHMNAARKALSVGSRRRMEDALEKVCPLVVRHYMEADTSEYTQKKVAQAMSQAVIINTLIESDLLRDKDDPRLRAALEHAAGIVMKGMKR